MISPTILRPAKKRRDECPFCEKSYNFPSRLKDHLISAHSTERPFQCDFCPSAFAIKSAYNRHLRTHTEEKPHLCPHCTSAFKSKAGLQFHIQLIHFKNNTVYKYECLFCQQKLFSSTNLEQHLRSHTKERPFFCKICPHQSDCLSNLRKQISTHDPKRCKTFQCKLCPKQFYHSSDLQNHIRSHMNERRHVCEICGSDFVTKDGLKQHMRIHNCVEEKRHECQTCYRRFKTNSKLWIHLKSHLEGENKLYDCVFCANKRFPAVKGLFQHIQFHTREKWFSCHVCFSEYGTSRNLNRHIQTAHSSEDMGRFTCLFCSDSKQFLFREKFYKHLRTHTGEKPRSCNVY